LESRKTSDVCYGFGFKSIFCTYFLHIFFNFFEYYYCVYIHENHGKCSMLTLYLYLEVWSRLLKWPTCYDLGLKNAFFNFWQAFQMSCEYFFWTKVVSLCLGCFLLHLHSFFYHLISSFIPKIPFLIFWIT